MVDPTDPDLPLSARVQDIEETAEKLEREIEEFVSEDLPKLKNGLETLENLDEEELNDLVDACRRIRDHKGSDEEIARELGEEIKDLKREREALKQLKSIAGDFERLIGDTNSRLTRLAYHSSRVTMQASEEFDIKDTPALHINPSSWEEPLE